MPKSPDLPSNLQVAAAKMALWANRPDIFVRELFGVTPDPWQDEALRAFPTSPRMAFKACAGPGKTALLSWVAWNFLLTRPHSAIGATSITGPNFYANLWPELARWYERGGDLLKSQFEIVDGEIRHRLHKLTWLLQARTWAASADETNIANVLAGLHANYVMWLLDESGDMPKGILPICESIFNGSPIEAHVIQAGNPSSITGALYHACTTAASLWRVTEITADPDDPMRTPRVSVQAARDMIQQYGRDNPWVMVRIFGKFPPGAFNALIGPDEIRAAMRRAYREYDIRDFPRIIGGDIADGGEDMTSIAKRQGVQAFPWIRLREPDVTQIAGMLSRQITDWQADATFLDRADFGLESHLRLLNHNAIRINFGGKARDETRFFNKRAEMYVEMVDWIKGGGALPPEDTPGCAELIAGLTNTTYTLKKGLMLLEPKESVKAKIGYSPDDTDSLALTFAEKVLKGGAKNPYPVNSRIPGLHQQAQQPQDYDPYRAIFPQS